ncbi:MAG: hypothetical protein ACKOTB_14525, partial [Planctomycetia bacterium]
MKGDSLCNFNLLGFAFPRDCDSANDVSNGSGATIRATILASNATQCTAEYRRLPDFGETRYL